jgi:DNA polymerase
MMDESRRRAYLRAMGIDLWVPRGGAAAGDNGLLTTASAPAEPPRPPPAAPALAPPVALPPEPPPEPQSDSRWEPVWEPDWEPAPASHTAPVPADARPPLAPSGRQPRPGPTPPAVATLPPDPTGMDWDTLAATVAGCRACALCETRTQTVFGVGDRQARLLVIGEAPGADEDRAGEPFVGRAGQLLNRMLAAIGLDRDQVYIANILKCRPPGNRDPRPDEVEHCRGYLARQVALVRPRAILSVGRISAQTLLGTDTPVGRLRGRWFDYGPDAIPLRVTYHPAYLLRSPEYKGKAWEDLTALAKRLGDRAD